MTKDYYETIDGRKIYPKAPRPFVFDIPVTQNVSEEVLPDGITKHDISTEEWREYVYDDETTYFIGSPKTLYINHKSEGISHRVVDSDGVTHYPYPSWIALRWLADPEVSF